LTSDFEDPNEKVLPEKSTPKIVSQFSFPNSSKTDKIYEKNSNRQQFDEQQHSLVKSFSGGIEKSELGVVTPYFNFKYTDTSNLQVHNTMLDSKSTLSNPNNLDIKVEVTCQHLTRICKLCRKLFSYCHKLKVHLKLLHKHSNKFFVDTATAHAKMLQI